MNAQTFASVSEIAALNQSIGHHWFSKATMKFFNSKTYGSVHHGRYFISSEKFNSDSQRRFTIRVVQPDGSIDTVGEFQAYTTYKAAWKALDDMIANGTVPSYGPPVIDAR